MYTAMQHQLKAHITLREQEHSVYTLYTKQTVQDLPNQMLADKRLTCDGTPFEPSLGPERPGSQLPIITVGNSK